MCVATLLEAGRHIRSTSSHVQIYFYNDLTLYAFLHSCFYRAAENSWKRVVFTSVKQLEITHWHVPSHPHMHTPIARFKGRAHSHLLNVHFHFLPAFTWLIGEATRHLWVADQQQSAFGLDWSQFGLADAAGAHVLSYKGSLGIQTWSFLGLFFLPVTHMFTFRYFLPFRPCHFSV